MGSSIGLDNIIIVICAVMCSSTIILTTTTTMASVSATTAPTAAATAATTKTSTIRTIVFPSQRNLTDDSLPVINPQSFVDKLIADYFKTEKMLWQLIERRADNVLLKVFKSHETFFDQVLEKCGSGILAMDLIPDVEMLAQIAANVNGTTEMGQSHLQEQELDRQSITEYSNSALKILKDASSLFDYATNDTLWENIITVSESW